MIGPKKLGVIRQELQRELAATGEDPIRCLEERLTVLQRQGPTIPGKSEVLQSLQRFLGATGNKARRSQRSGVSK